MNGKLNFYSVIWSRSGSVSQIFTVMFQMFLEIVNSCYGLVDIANFSGKALQFLSFNHCTAEDHNELCSIIFCSEKKNRMVSNISYSKSWCTKHTVT